MKHLFVPYELALKLKEEGFYESCFARYEHEKLTTFSLTQHSYQVGWINAPLYQQVIDWLYNNHNIFISPTFKSDTKEFDCIIELKEGFRLSGYKSNIYEAYNSAIEIALETIKTEY